MHANRGMILKIANNCSGHDSSTLREHPMTIGLLRSKITIPSLHQNSLRRDRITTAIENAVSTSTPVLLCAPFGYGKTTALAHWATSAASRGTAVAWLTLDKYDNEPSSFFAYLQAALSEALGRPADGLVDSYSHGDPRVPVLFIHDETRSSDQRTVLCLDDLHELHDTGVLEFIGLLCENTTPFFDVIMSSRTMPPFVTPAMIASESVSTMGQEALGFDNLEIEAILRRSGNATHADVESIRSKTEGWPLAVRLEGTPSRSTPSQSPAFKAIFSPHSGEEMAQVLFTGFFDAMTDEERSVLLVASFFDYCCPQLVLQTAPDRLGITLETNRAVKGVVTANAFVSSVGEAAGQRWFRLHSLLRSELQRQALLLFDNDELRTLHRKAAAALIDYGHHAAGMEHAVAAGDDVFCADCLNEICGILAASNPSSALFDLEYWAAMIPEDLLHARPVIEISLALCRSLQAFDDNRGFIEDTIDRFSDDAHRLALASDPDIHGRFNLLLLVRAVSLTDPLLVGESIKQDTLTCFGTNDPLKGRLFQLLSYLEIAQDNVDRAFEHISAAEQIMNHYPMGLFAVHLLGNRAELLIRLGRLGDAEAFCADSVSGVLRCDWAHFPNTLVCEHARVLAYQGRFADASAYLDELAGQPTAGRYSPLLQAVLNFRLGIALDDPRRVELATTTISSVPSSSELAKAMRTAASGDLVIDSVTLDYSPDWDMAAPGELCVAKAVRFYSQTIQAETLLASGHADGVRMARSFYSQIVNRERRRGFMTPLVGALVGLSWACALQDDVTMATEALREAALVAEEIGRYDVFVTLPPCLRPLLLEISAESAQIRRLETKVSQLRIELGLESVRMPADTKYRILTMREVETVSLAAKGYSNQRIAEALSVTLPTVKSHMYSASKKLYAKNRTETVLRAQELGLI